jgi:allantoinase
VRVELALRNGIIVTPHSTYRATIGIEQGRIVAIGDNSIEAVENIDLGGKYVLPGLIDAHTHFRDPGFPELEDFTTGTRAAAKGGITLVYEMPTSLPGVDSVEVLISRAAQLETRAVVDFALYAGGSNVKEVPSLAEAGAIAFKSRLRPPTPGREQAWAGQSVADDGAYLQILQTVAKTGRLACLHAENWQVKRTLYEQAERTQSVRPETIAQVNPPIVEADHVQRAILLAGFAGARLSLCHLANRTSLGMVRQAKDRGQSVYAEVSFENLLLTTADLERFGRYLPPYVTPPEDNEAIWRALEDGTLDHVASDHAPHSRQQIEQAWERPGEKAFGIVCNELLVPLILRRVNEGRFSLRKLARVMAEAPARNFGLYPRKGVIQVGSDADLTVVDLDRRGVVRSDELEAKTGFTMFDGEPLWGLPALTLVRGKIVMRDGHIIGNAGFGRWIRPAG